MKVSNIRANTQTAGASRMLAMSLVVRPTPQVERCFDNISERYGTHGQA
jgi:hypothetical protein